ncbi:unnamed protein product, partial [Meganyctiphanes norvegica]
MAPSSHCRLTDGKNKAIYQYTAHNPAKFHAILGLISIVSGPLQSPCRCLDVVVQNRRGGPAQSIYPRLSGPDAESCMLGCLWKKLSTLSLPMNQRKQFRYIQVHLCVCTDFTSSFLTVTKPKFIHMNFMHGISPEKSREDFHQFHKIFSRHYKEDYYFQNIFFCHLVVTQSSQGPIFVDRGGHGICSKLLTPIALIMSSAPSCSGNLITTVIIKLVYKEKDFSPAVTAIPNFQSDFYSKQSIKIVNSYVFRSLLIEKQVIVIFCMSEKNSDFFSHMHLRKTALHDPCVVVYLPHAIYIHLKQGSVNQSKWMFNMGHLKLSKQESATDGFVLAGDIGLRLKAMEYWRCAETGLASPNASHGDSSFKLVIAEALPDVPRSNVDSFLTAHGGPGVQHIGLHTPHILHTVQTIGNRGVRFRKPPPTYYHEVGKLSEITAAGFGSEVQSFQDLGILIDSEADVFTGMDGQDGRGKKIRYLMQIFSHPIFGVESFFLEIVQRCGAQGFGQGNIAALARSIQLYQKQQE